MSVRKVSADSYGWHDGGWYVDGNGEIVLTCHNYALYDRNDVLIDGTQGITVDSFVPSLSDDNIVFCFAEHVWFKYDISNNCISDIYSIDSGDLYPFSSFAVHSNDCGKVWITDYGGNTWYKYLLDDDGISLSESFSLDHDNYQFLANWDSGWNLNLSVDCNFYTLSLFHRGNEVYYGKFDRASADFKRIASHVFGGYQYVVNSIISPDMSSIYYILKRGDYIDFVKVDIVDGIPDFDNYSVFHSEENFGWVHYLYYGPDGNVYYWDLKYGILGVIESVDGEINCRRVFDSNGELSFSSTHRCMCSWNIADPCGYDSQDPCANLKKPVILWR